MNIRDARNGIPDSFLLDANVLYFLHYPNFDSLQRANGNTPKPWQLADYQSWWKRSLEARSVAHAAIVTIAETVRLFEYAEFEAFWLTQPPSTRPDRDGSGKFSGKVCKDCRFAYPTELVKIRRTTRTFINKLLTSTKLLASASPSATEYSTAMAEWVGSASDFPDAMIVAAGKKAGITDIASDDIDLLTFDGIRLHTANARAIEAARAADRLIQY